MTRQPLSPNLGAPPAASQSGPRARGPVGGGWRRRLAAGWQATFAGQTWSGRLPPASATVAAQFWAESTPWHITAGWTLAAALLAAGALQGWSDLDWKGLILLWILVDVLWGALWRLAGGRPHLLALKGGPASGAAPEQSAAALRLPYVREGSPAAQLMSLDEANSIPYLVRVAVPTLLLALVVAGALGIQALLATLLVAAVAVGGWTLRRTLRTPPLALHAVATVLLPWLLVALLWNILPGSERWPHTFWLAVGWTLHLWGESRATLWPGDRVAPWLLGAAHLLILAVLVLNRVPIWVPPTAVLLLPTWLRLLRRQPLGGPGGLAAWWLAALITSALALGWQ